MNDAWYNLTNQLKSFYHENKIWNLFPIALNAAFHHPGEKCKVIENGRVAIFSC